MINDPEAVFIAALDTMPDQFRLCRELQHTWLTTRPFRMVDSNHEAARQPRGGSAVYAERVLTCQRCGMERSDAFRVSSRRGHTTLRKISGTYRAPEGYAIEGLGRGVTGLREFVYGAAFNAAALNAAPVHRQGRPAEAERANRDLAPLAQEPGEEA